MRLFSTIFFLFLSVSLFAQSDLVLRKGYSAREIHRFRVGDSLRFSIHGSDEIYSGNIEVLGDSTLLISDQTIAYHSISAVYLYRNSYGRQVFLKGLPKAAIQSSMFLFVYGNINAVVYELWSLPYLRMSIIRSASMALGGLAVQQIYNRTTYRKCSTKRYRLIKITFP